MVTVDSGAHTPQSGYAFGALSLAVALLAGASARAEAQCRALLVQPASAELMQRIEGQSQDVACELVRAPAGERALDDEEACRAFAREQSVDGVLRVVESADGAPQHFEVVLCGRAEPSERRAVQAKSASTDALSESALYEAVALVVRSALVDLAAAIEEAERARAEQARRAREEEARAAAVRDAERARAEQARRAQEEKRRAEYATVDSYGLPSLADPHWLIMAGFELTWIGADRTALEVGTRAGLDLGVLQAGLLAAYGFDAPLRDASTELRLARHRLGAFAGIPLRMTRRSSFEALLDAGVAALERNSVNLTDPNVMPTAARTTWSALFGVEVALVHRFAGAVGVRVHAGLDVLPGAPRYLYEDLRDGVTTTTERKGAQRLQPRAGVMVFASF